MAPSPSSAFLRLLRRRPGYRNLPCSLPFLRSMGGGPRTFPGGLNKWQWKRMHEKKAREKERKLLDHERQLYQSRLRSQIRANLSGIPEHPPSSSDQFGPMTAKEQVKALADRFMKPGAEDLWNEDDGPLKEPSPQTDRTCVPDSDLRKLVPNRSNAGVNLEPNGLVDLGGRRSYSTCGEKSDLPIQFDSRKVGFVGNAHSQSTLKLLVFDYWNPLQSRRRVLNGLFSYNLVNLSGDRYAVCAYNRINLNIDRCYSVEAGRGLRSKYGVRRVRNSSSDDEESGTQGLEDGDCVREVRLRRSVKEMMSSAALMKHDSKKERRFNRRFWEGEDLSAEVSQIRDEFKLRDSVVEEERHMGEDESLLSYKRFDDCNISPLTVKALSSAGYIRMTKVQDATISACLEGKDVLVKAKSGTGKSAAFLLPAIEAVLNASASSVNQRVPPIFVLILSPTRELASQIAAETKVLLHYHNGIGVQTLIGGTRFKEDLRRLESDPCQIIVATPGRLLDHIENKSGFSVRLMGLKVLVMDEADKLLDLGFRKDIEKIVDCIPRQRQTMLLSATVPKEVRRIAQLVLKKDHFYLDTVGLGCLETHSKVIQSYIIAPHDNHFHILYHILKEHIMRVIDYKVIVFCTTAMVTSLLYLLLRELKFNVRETHSRKTQIFRTRITDEFRESTRLILVTSDVSARGMNYPDVTLVVQVGMPIDREQYIHRLGRTGREGKEGEGVLLLAPWEEYFLDDMKDLPLQKSPLPEIEFDLKNQVEEIMSGIDMSVKEGAYHAWLGYYNSIREIGRDKTTLVELANQFCCSIGLQKPPPLFRKTANKMGLRDISGIRIRK